MPTLAICRVCLVRNKRLHVIANTTLEPIFEMVSGVMLNTDDGKPNSVCYICFALLRKCWKFKEMARKTDEFLKEILDNGKLGSDHTFTVDGERPIMSVSTIKCVSMPEYIKNENSEVFVKEEIVGYGERISVQVQTEGGPVAVTPIEYDIRMETNSLKRELNYPELDGDDSFDMSCLSSLSQITKPEIPFTECNEIQNTKTRRKRVRAALISTRNKTQYVCDICKKQFKQINNLDKHMKTHTDEKLTCDKCIITFSDKVDFQDHMELPHTDPKFNVCDMCQQVYFSKYSLKIHITQKHMKTTVKSHDCDSCNKSFNHRGALRLHMRIHTGDKPYACDKCSKTFSQKGTLQRHIRMHTGEKPYACDKCTKTFNQESSLKRHIKMHNGEKPYACTRCSKAYYERSHLTRHIRTHTGEKPYACDRCFQTFGQSSNLQAHMKKHTGQKATNYECYECNKTFDHKSIFKRHLLKHTQEKPYPCDRCDKKYADKRTLQRHIGTHTPID